MLAAKRRDIRPMRRVFPQFSPPQLTRHVLFPLLSPSLLFSYLFAPVKRERAHVCSALIKTPFCLSAR